MSNEANEQTPQRIAASLERLAGNPRGTGLTAIDDQANTQLQVIRELGTVLEGIGEELERQADLQERSTEALEEIGFILRHVSTDGSLNVSTD